MPPSSIQIASFHVLPVLYSPSTPHYLYIRKDQSTNTDRTLFVANLPPDSTESNLRAFFGACGPVEAVTFGGRPKHTDGQGSEDSDSDSDSGMISEEEPILVDEQPSPPPKPSKKKAKKQPGPPKIAPLSTDSDPALPRLNRTSQSAKILFLSPLSLVRALQLPTVSPLTFPPASSSTDASTGLSRYIASYTLARPALHTIKAHANSSIAHFEYLKKVEVERVTSMGEDIVDEDGFTLVVRGGKYGRNLAGGGVAVASRDWERNKEEIEGKKKKSKELKDFYRWQIREAKREDLAQLRSKFEADKEKIEKLKGSRRFKPY